MGQLPDPDTFGIDCELWVGMGDEQLSDAEHRRVDRFGCFRVRGYILAHCFVCPVSYRVQLHT